MAATMIPQPGLFDGGCSDDRCSDAFLCMDCITSENQRLAESGDAEAIEWLSHRNWRANAVVHEAPMPALPSNPTGTSSDKGARKAPSKVRFTKHEGEWAILVSGPATVGDNVEVTSSRGTQTKVLGKQVVFDNRGFNNVFLIATDAETSSVKVEANHWYQNANGDIVKVVQSKTGNLYGQRYADGELVYEAGLLRGLTKEVASPLPTKTTSAAYVVTEPGLYRHSDGSIIKVVRSRESGRLYSKRITEDNPKGVFAPSAMYGIVELLSKEDARAFGHATGFCCVCSRELTDPVSVEAGIGPICATRF